MPALRILAAAVSTVAGLTALTWIAGETDRQTCVLEREDAERRLGYCEVERLHDRSKAEVATAALGECRRR